MTEREEFMTYLNALGRMTPGFTPDENLLAVYDEAAAKVGYGRCARALKQFIAEKSGRDPFPSVSDMVGKAEFNALDAEEIAAKILGAVAKYGSYRGHEAREYLGVIGWDIVTIEGGWESLCQMLTYENSPILQAQWRKLAAVMIARKKTEKLTEVGYLQSVGDTVRRVLPQKPQELDRD